MKKIEMFENKEIIEANQKDNGFFYTWRAYEKTQEWNSEILVFDDVIWEQHIEAMVQTFKKLEIKEFVVTVHQAGLQDVLAEFEKHGFKISKMVKVETTFTDYATGGRQQKNAILLAA